MTGDQTEALIGMLVTFGLLVLMVLPSVIGIVREKRVDRQLREAQESEGARKETQKSSSRSTVPSTATWYAEGRRSKKLVNS
ncbi:MULTISPECIES: hypothetical protein [unclassified Streptomyces]|uniref:hypothetical protein n=1 Tax=unclassified Streptomyces TaxID=2593676 RepID=UPI002442FBB0|nr:hypothetical protein [Streptomyces sp. DH41]MDG9721890.1 hypothetical protein [Streptomyces sp. DH41]